MKNNIKSRITALLTLSAVAVLGFAGCAQKDSDTESTVQIPEDSAPVLNETAEEPAETETVTEAVTEAEEEFDLSKVSTFELTSESIADGVWNTVITDTSKGSNVSPQLSWEPVESAGDYAIYMIDTSANNWLHWKSPVVTETNLAEGWAGKEEYIGPYPPGGTHTYDVYVFALKNAPEKMAGLFDNANDNFMNNWQIMVSSLDTDKDGASGNIISYGYISGTYTSGE